jgi:hypothetical protein
MKIVHFIYCLFIVSAASYVFPEYPILIGLFGFGIGIGYMKEKIKTL